MLVGVVLENDVSGLASRRAELQSKIAEIHAQRAYSDPLYQTPRIPDNMVTCRQLMESEWIPNPNGFACVCPACPSHTSVYASASASEHRLRAPPSV